MLLILFLLPVPILQCLRMKNRTTRLSLTFPPLSLVPVLVTTSAQSCSHFCLGFHSSRKRAACFGFTSSAFSCGSRVFYRVPRRSGRTTSLMSCRVNLIFLLPRGLLGAASPSSLLPLVSLFLILHSPFLLL